MNKMPRVVLDTNVLVSGLRSSLGASHQILKRIGGREFRHQVSVPLLFEYEARLKADSRESGLTREDIDAFLDYLCQTADRHRISYLWRPCLKDPKDDFVLELAVNSESAWIVTHNRRDFGGAARFGVKIVSPKDFLKITGGPS